MRASASVADLDDPALKQRIASLKAFETRLRPTALAQSRRRPHSQCCSEVADHDRG